jgi:hypothetical protein
VGRIDLEKDAFHPRLLFAHNLEDGTTLHELVGCIIGFFCTALGKTKLEVGFFCWLGPRVIGASQCIKAMEMYNKIKAKPFKTGGPLRQLEPIKRGVSFCNKAATRHLSCDS